MPTWNKWFDWFNKTTIDVWTTIDSMDIKIVKRGNTAAIADDELISSCAISKNLLWYWIVFFIN